MAAMNVQEGQPEGRFRLALKRLIGASSEEETREAVRDLEEALRTILEKRDEEWRRALKEKEQGSPQYDPTLKEFTEDMARAVTEAVEAKIDARISDYHSNRPDIEVSDIGRPKGDMTPIEPQKRATPATPPATQKEIEELRKQVEGTQEQLIQMRETLKGQLKPEVESELKKEARSLAAEDIREDDELPEMIGELVEEVKNEVLTEMRDEVKAELKEAIKEEAKKELMEEL